MKVTMDKIEITRINLEFGFYILCIPDERKVYDFLLCHDKHYTVLSLYQGQKPQCLTDDCIMNLANIGYHERIQEYLNMLDIEDTF